MTLAQQAVSIGCQLEQCTMLVHTHVGVSSRVCCHSVLLPASGSPQPTAFCKVYRVRVKCSPITSTQGCSSQGLQARSPCIPLESCCSALPFKTLNSCSPFRPPKLLLALQQCCRFTPAELALTCMHSCCVCCIQQHWAPTTTRLWEVHVEVCSFVAHKRLSIYLFDCFFVMPRLSCA
jgi:hypothetical protein